MTVRPFEGTRTTLGFIGLGNMGTRIVQRLLAAGYKTQVYDAQPERADSLEKQGAIRAASLDQLAQTSDVILSCLTDDAAVMSVYSGSVGVLRQAKPGTVVLEMSTISPDASRKIANLGVEVGVHVLDVAISGSTPAAERGEVVLFGGGNPDLFEAARPVLRAFSKKAFHLGPSGAGTTMKLVVNAILGIGMQAIAEASALGQKAGLDRKVLLEVLSQTTVIAPAHAGKLARAAVDEFSAQFPLRLMIKDFGLVLDEANKRNASVPATEASYRISSAALSVGYDEDFSVVMKYMETLSANKRSASASASVPRQS
jgi:3-hydroxyisobutyrate dehydrogenase